jgi:polyhydroxyalkanoate synthesis regulator phasin
MVDARRGGPALVPPALLTRVSWGAILAGAISAIALTALLSLLGLGIGLGVADPTRADGFDGIPTGTLVWWAVTSILATGIGAFVAARLAGIPHGITGALHGLAVWSVATIVMLWLATSAVGTVLGAAGNVVTTTARVTTDVVGAAGGVVGQAGQAAAPDGEQVDQARAEVQREADQIFGAAGVGQENVDRAQEIVGEAAQNIMMRPGQANVEINRAIERLFEGPDAALTPQERERLINELAQRGGMTRQEAEQAADRWQQQATAAREQTEETVREVQTRAGEITADVVDTASQVAWGMFLISLAGLVAALIGSALGGASLGPAVLAGAGAAGAHDRDRGHPDRHDRHPDEFPERDPPPGTVPRR